jgi:hypothetical protein
MMMKDLATRALWRAVYEPGNALSKLGDRWGVPWLTYNPILFLWFHMLSVRLAPGIFRSLRSVFPAAQRYADVGGGSGGMAAHAKHLGLDVTTCEHSATGRMLARLQGVRAVSFDVATDGPDRLGAPADIAYSIEVAEHIPRELSRRFAGFIAGAAPIAVVTAAPPGQGGHGHINEQPREYWIEQFREAGMDYRSDESARLRSELLANLPDQQSYIGNSVMVFARRDP